MNGISKRYQKYKEFLLDELTYIDSMFELYVFLKNQHIDRLDILNTSPAFFRLTENALLESSSIRLSRVYDSNKKTVTIKKFLNFIKQNRKEIFKEDDQDAVDNKIQEDRDKFLGYEEKILGLKELRDTSLAHNDICNLKENFDMWEEKNITIGDIRALIKFGAEVINHFSFYSDDTAHSIKAANQLDVENVLRDLEKND
jgi:hypothetical protein